MNFVERANAKATLTFEPTIVPVILIDEVALNKMFLYVSECPDEIGWLGTATHDDSENTYSIHDVYLFKQQVHATTTEIKPEGLELFATEILQEPNGVEIWNNIRMWGHSHVNMGLTPSAQDNKQMQEFSEIGQEWFIRLIANKKGELCVDLFHYTKGLYFTNVPWEILEDLEEASEAEVLRAQILAMQRELDLVTKAKVTALKTGIVAEMKEKVSKITYTKATTTHINNNYNEIYKTKPLVSSYGRNLGYGFRRWDDFPPNEQEIKAYAKEIPKYMVDEFYSKKNTSLVTNPLEDVGDVEEDSIMTGFHQVDVIENRQAVYNFFSERELEYLGLNTNVTALQIEMADYGFKDVFSYADLRMILAVAQAETDKAEDQWGGMHY